MTTMLVMMPSLLMNGRGRRYLAYLCRCRYRCQRHIRLEVWLETLALRKWNDTLGMLQYGWTSTEICRHQR